MSLKIFFTMEDFVFHGLIVEILKKFENFHE